MRFIYRRGASEVSTVGAATMEWAATPTFWRRRAHILIALLLAYCPTDSHAESRYSSVKSGDCRQLSGAIGKFYEARGLSAEECEAARGWRLFAVSSDERSWFELSRESTLWSSEQQVVHKHSFGYFPNIGAEKVEWRITKTGAPTAFIFRIASQDPQNVTRNLTRLFVVAFKEDAPYFCGVASSNEEARALSENEEQCSSALAVHTLPK